MTFNDLVKGTGKNKPGFWKVSFCAEQAANDGLRFFWLDTCCIDKTSSAELTEAINSMFKWYHKAAKCYAYLSDVSINNQRQAGLLPKRSWEHSFRNSRWFTRGWTLQELPAPASVDFFSADGQRLGSRNSLVQELQDITGIPARALQGFPLNQFEVEERMLWMRERVTKREEDMAYSLLGIFDVYIPLIYGEGRDNALSRLLKEIHDPAKDLNRVLHFASQPDAAVAFQATRSVESEWEDFIESRRKRGGCFNCGLQSHWENNCSRRCGRCTDPCLIRSMRKD